MEIPAGSRPRYEKDALNLSAGTLRTQAGLIDAMANAGAGAGAAEADGAEPAVPEIEQAIGASLPVTAGLLL